MGYLLQLSDLDLVLGAILLILLAVFKLADSRLLYQV